MKKNNIQILTILLFLVTASRAQEPTEQKSFEVYGFVMTDAGYNANQMPENWAISSWPVFYATSHGKIHRLIAMN